MIRAPALALLCLGFAAPAAAQSSVADVVGAQLDAYTPAASPYDPARPAPAAPAALWDDGSLPTPATPRPCQAGCVPQTRSGRTGAYAVDVPAQPRRRFARRFGARALHRVMRRRT
ncbi:MAG: hypothetical protein H6719_27225 [Sandaracinaceae bacterium]|nr:hypothetical protein [Sandaracinaceae bacterium]